MALPRVQPIILTRRKEPFDDPDWLFDVKYDGFRALSYVEQGRGRLISRNANDLIRFAAFADQLASLLEVEEVILDGEVIAADETGRPQFYELLRGTRTPAYVAFDLLWLDGCRPAFRFRLGEFTEHSLLDQTCTTGWVFSDTSRRPRTSSKEKLRGRHNGLIVD